MPQTLALRLSDVLCVLYPDKRDKIKEEEHVFYDCKDMKFGEHLVAQGVLTREQIEVGLLQQQLELGRLAEADKETLRDVQRRILLGASNAIDDLHLLVSKTKLVVRK
jgi:hypothetical protein